MFSWSDTLPKCFTEWYDPVIQLRKNAPEISDFHEMAGLGVIKDKFVFALGVVNRSCSQSVRMLDVSSQSPCWISTVDMLVCRKLPEVGVLDNCIYAVSFINILLIRYYLLFIVLNCRLVDMMASVH